MSVLLDAFALIADEPAADQVEALLRRGDAAITAVNLAEALDVLQRVQGISRERLETLITPLVGEAMTSLAIDERIAREAADIRARRYHRTPLARRLHPARTGALRELLQAVPQAIVLRVEGDDLATMAAIAKRTGRSPESVRLLVYGKRGPGGFPPAAGRLDARTRVWRWTDVARWFEEALDEPLPAAADSAFLQAFNDALEIRRLSDRLGKHQRRAIAKLLGNESAAA